MDILNILLKNESLNFEQSQTFFDAIMQGNVSDIELTAALVALKLKGETVDEIAGSLLPCVNTLFLLTLTDLRQPIVAVQVVMVQTPLT